MFFRDGKRNRWDDNAEAGQSSSSSSKNRYFDNDADEDKAKEEEIHKGGLSSQDRE